MASAQQWTEVNKYVASDRSSGSHFGKAMYVSGNRMIVGAPWEDFDASGMNQLSDAGAAYIFSRANNGNWVEEQKIVAPAINRSSGSSYGDVVAINGMNAIVGVPSYDYDTLGQNYLTATGLVHIYSIDSNGVWYESQRIQPPVRNSFSSYLTFGVSLAVDDNYLMIGAENTVFIYKKNTAGLWIFSQQIGGSSDFGSSVSISGNYAVVGAVKEYLFPNRSGAAFILERNVSTGLWTKGQRIVANDRTHLANFGNSVSIFGNELVVGANWDKNSSAVSGNPTLSFAGSAYFFRRDVITNVWNLVNKVTPPDRASSNKFGHTVSMSGDMMLTGSFNSTDSAGSNFLNSAGAAYLYKKGINGNWALHKKITPLDRDSFDTFGGDSGFYWRSLFLSGNNAFVAAVEEDHDEMGLNHMWSSGSIYQFSACQTVYDSLTVTACGDYVSPDNKLYSSSGTYRDTVSTVSFCDSIIITSLTIVANSSATIIDTVCLFYTSPSGRLLDSSGVYSDIIPNQSGCDSIITINLTVSKTFGQQTLSSCGPITSPSGKLLTASGIYLDTLINGNQFACDSIISIHLTIPIIDTSISQMGFVLTASSAGSAYQWLDCSNGYIPIIGETQQSFTAVSNGSYAVEISNNSCQDTSDCVSVISVGTKDVHEGKARLSIYPNPAAEQLVVNINSLGVTGDALRFYNMKGYLVLEHQIKKEVESIPLNELPNGIYVLRYKEYYQKLFISR